MSVDVLLWIAMAIYGVVMFALSPRAASFGEFFAAEDNDGRQISTGFLVGSVVISWLFAKSITNAANLGASFGLVGSVAYAGWYLSIPVVGVVAYKLRTTRGAKSLSQFVASKYGRLASLGFMVAISIRLFNEVWSNTAVVGAYFGESGSTGYYVAALAFAAVTLGYSLRGGLRSSVLTDAFQCAMAMFLLVFALALVVPDAGAQEMLASGEWTLVGGVDLLLVGLLQSLSYGFHDPVLTDRSFISSPRSMLKGYLVAGALAAAFIVLFGLVGVHAHVTGVEISQDAPLQVAQAFGVAVLAGMSVMMMLSAGSTLDSTLSSFSKAVVQDLGGVAADHDQQAVPSQRLAELIRRFDSVSMGRVVMVVTVILGSLPLFAGAEILQATTVSGTMVVGLAPVFLLYFVRSAGPFAFHLAFWPGVAIGVAFAAGWSPGWLAVGQGSYDGLLGVNLFATACVVVLFFVGVGIDRMRHR
jgi:Na+/proline symporter